MKKTISVLALTLVFFSCSKTELFDPSEPLPESELELELELGSNLKSGDMAITTDAATFVTSATATIGGDVQTSGGGGSIAEKGICFRKNPNPKIIHNKVISGSGSGSFTCVLSGLKGDTVYHARAYVIKSNGNVKYGNEITFTALTDYGTVTDASGNVYHSININGQVWTVKNLKTKKYRDGTDIPKVSNDVAWASQTSGAFCNYDNDASNVSTYGRLYNWFAVTDYHNIAPVGWHVATSSEVTALLNYLGGWYTAGGELKEAGFAHWGSPNTGAVNSVGLTALSGGYRSADSNTIISAYTKIGVQGRFWASYTPGGASADYFYMQKSATSVMGSFTADGIGPWFNPYDKCNGYSVRLVKD
ncbi:MAG: fibrobacter succinogenes major paralogous domain-containing protein [Bacteroidales bacterium]|nr:fibrobacter succinogenes major paralogous domain-containing protein [Bacteroidales bacterium]MCF8455512.1 fibrobacter succinogenes major paralogous domain-containing protein [Bacteroidales bacterium]